MLLLGSGGIRGTLGGFMKILLIILVLAISACSKAEEAPKDPPIQEPTDGRIGPPLYPPTGAG